MELSKPVALTLDEIRQESVKDATFQRIREDFDKPTWSKELQKYEVFKHEMMFYDDIFLRGTRIVIPASLKERVLKLAHEGHPGIDVMKRRVREKVWWPNIDKAVENYVKKCHGCLMVSLPDKPEPLKIREHPSSCFEEVAAIGTIAWWKKYFGCCWLVQQTQTCGIPHKDNYKGYNSSPHAHVFEIWISC